MLLLIASLLITYCEYQRSWLVSGLYYIGFDAKDSLLFASSGYGIDIINVATPDDPQLISSIMTPGLPFGIKVVGNKVYACDDYAGMRIFDISNLSNPVEIGHIDTPGLATYLFIKQNIAYVADDWNGLRLIDVSNPSNPVELGFFDTPGRAIWVDVEDTFAYVSDYYNGLLVINVKNPSNPQLVGEWNNSVAYVWAVDVIDTLAYVTGEYYGGGRLKHFMVLNVSNPSSPFLVASLSLPEPPGNLVIKDDTIAFVTAQNSGIRIINIANPFNPYEINHIPERVLDGLAVIDSLLIAPYSWTCLRIYNVANLDSIPVIGTFYSGPLVNNVLVKNNNLFVARAKEHTTILAFDCTIPDSISLIDSLPLSYFTSPDSISLVDSLPLSYFTFAPMLYDPPYLYIGHGGNWSIFEFSNNTFQHISTTTISGYIEDFEKKDNILFCGGGSLCLRIYDISDLYHPQFLSSLNVPCSRMVLYDTLLFAVKRPDNFLYIINVADPQSPSTIATLNTQHWALSLALSYPYLFIGNDDWCLQVVDVSDPLNPQVVNTLSTPHSYIEDLIHQDTLLYMAGSYYWGLKIFNVSNPITPSLIDSCDTPGWANAITMNDGWIYCADNVALSLIKFFGASAVSEGRKGNMDVKLIVHPNPFRREVRFCITDTEKILGKKPFMLKLYDCAGRLINEFHQDNPPFLWDGRDINGNYVPSGVYFAQFLISGQSITKKIIKIE